MADWASEESDSIHEDIPLWGSLSGASARQARRVAEREAERARRVWEDLGAGAPRAADITTGYGLERSIGSGGNLIDQDVYAAEGRALRALEGVATGDGFTAGDRARMRMGEQQVASQMRAQREADMASLRQRGLGGSGAAIASSIGAQQAGANAMGNRDAQLQAAASDRALDAMSRHGAMASGMRGASDDFRRWDTDYQRGRQERNTQWNNRSRESHSRANQQVYENAQNRAAGMTNQYSVSSSARDAAQARQAQADAQGQAFLGGVLEEIF